MPLHITNALKIVILVLGALLGSSASANSLEVALCKQPQIPVSRMEMSEKLCRSFARALAQLPNAASEQGQAMLTPENLQTMANVTALWLSTQGVPVVGEVVDLGVLALGLHLMQEQAEEIAQALHRYAELTRAASSHSELNRAAAHLSQALAVAGINLVAFVLTHKASARVAKVSSGGAPGPSTRLVLSKSDGLAARSVAVDAVAPALEAGAALMAASTRPPSADAAGAGVDIELKYKEEWTPEQRAQADKKVADLNSVPEKRVVKNPQRSKTSASSRYKQAGRNVPRESDIDHRQDLQLGGADDVLNMDPLDSSVNRSIGSQIQHQIKNLPEGTRVGRISISD